MYRKIIITTALLAGLGAAQADTGFGLASGSTGYDIFAASKINPHVDLIYRLSQLSWRAPIHRCQRQ